jgi:NAD(P)-dependent dehydrogenase (short-subunit alcohol dehydrogenase family)
MAPLEGAAEIRKALLANDFAGNNARPAEVEKRLNGLLANRELARTLAAFTQAGAPVRYRSVDIRNAAEVRTVFEEARRDFGPIRALLHGAGVLEDRLIVDKSIEQFARVFDTKVGGFKALLAAAEPDELKLIVAFSSVTARRGNKGQADYAMANEALNKLAQAESRRRPACRVVAVNWGPWDGGMVGPALKREFERQGVPLLNVRDGAAALWRELSRGAAEPVEIVIGGDLESERPPAVRQAPAPELSLLFEREIDVDSCPVLSSHMIDGCAVVPLALMTEWFGHGALHENPGLMLHGLEDLRVLNGIRLREPSKLIRLLAGKTQRRQQFFEVELELRNGLREGKDVIHSRAKALLVEAFAPPPPYAIPEPLTESGYGRSVEEVYERILFHGSDLRGLRRIRCLNEAGMVAEAAGAPAPERWLKSPLRNGWLCDPLVLDSAFQMASLWCFERRGCVSLPGHAQSYRQFRPAFPAEGALVVLEVREASGRKMRGDFTFLDAEGVVIARLNGFEAVMDESLNRAFKPDRPADAAAL